MFRKLCTLLLSLASVPVLATSMAPRLEQIRQQHQIGAVSWAMVEGDKTVELGGLGFHDNRRLTPVTADSLFRVGSLTKLITAISLNMLAEQGRLDLDAPLTQQLAELPLASPYDTPITLRMMLEHSAGLQDMTPIEFDYPDPLSLTEAFNVAPHARQVRWPPGLHQSYNNVGAGYAGRALEKVTGEPWDRWVARHILTPLQMHRSTTLHSETVQAQLVTGYDRDRVTPIPYWHTLFRPFGALNTSARDFSQVLKLLINRGSYRGTPLLSPQTLAQMEVPQSTVAAHRGHQYGYGAGLYHWYRHQQPLLGHGGDGDGYLAHFAYNPVSQRGIFVVINAFHHPAIRALRRPLEEWVVAPLPPVQLPETKLPVAQLEALVGQWQAATQRFPARAHQPDSVTLELRNGQLSYIANQQRTVLIPVSEGRFRGVNDGGPTHIFFEWQGTHYWQSDLGNYRRLQPTNAP